MDEIGLLWGCGHCGQNLHHLGIDEHCISCGSRRDSSAIVVRPDRVDLPVHQGDDRKLEDRPIDPTSKEFLEDSAISLKPIDVDRPNHSTPFQTYSNGPDAQFEDSLFSLNDPGVQDWVPSEKILFSEAKGRLTFSLATGEPGTAPRRRAYSPARRAEVAMVRKHGACSPCRRSKHACVHSLQDREAMQKAKQIPTIKQAGLVPNTASLQLANSSKPAKNSFKLSSAPPEVLSCGAGAQREPGTARASTNPRSVEHTLFLPVPPILTFVSEGNSKLPSPRPSSKSKKKALSGSNKAAVTSTIGFRRRVRETLDSDTGQARSSCSTSAAATHYAPGPLTPRADKTRFISDIPGKSQQTRHSATTRLGDANKRNESQASGTKSSTRYLEYPELDTTDVFEEFTWINEIYDDQLESENLLSPFSSNISTASDIDRWDSSTDITGASLATTPFTDDEITCWTPV
ncbi:hypothetical protein MMC30_008883 [Trapelia coarctata]|nr:hypothetical protein [Trapelia coarctata]